MYTLVLSVLIYWLVFFVTCYIVVEMGQDMFYDEVTPHATIKVGLGSLILALLATWVHPSFDTIFTSNIAWTMLQAIVWFAVFVLAFQFHPTHALVLSLITMVLVTGVATLGVDSLTKSTPTLAPVKPRGNEPVRRSLTAPAVVADPAKDGTPTKAPKSQ